MAHISDTGLVATQTQEGTVAISVMHPYKTGIEQIGPNLYAYLQYNGTWGMSNSGILVGKDSAIVIDTFMYGSIIKPFMETLHKTTNKPVRYLINTHSHGDHTNGNEHFTSSTIISHVNCLEEMKAGTRLAAEREANSNLPRPPRPVWMHDQMVTEMAQVVKTYPNMTFQDTKMTIYLDEVELQLLHYGPAHTTGDVSIFLPKYDTVFVGDLGFFYCTPIANNSVSNFIVSLDKLMALPVTKFVSGHGPIGTKEAMMESREYLEFLLDEAKKGIKAGTKSDVHAKELNLGAFAKWGEHERVTNNLRTAYRDLGATQLAQPA